MSNSFGVRLELIVCVFLKVNASDYKLLGLLTEENHVSTKNPFHDKNMVRWRKTKVL